MKIQAIKKLFTEHRSSVNETYFQHLKKALFFRFRSLKEQLLYSFMLTFLFYS